MHTKESFAAMLDGREMGSEITKAEEQEAKAAGLVVLFGYSDDNAEFRGAIHDEIGCYEGHEFKVTAEGVLEPWERGEEKAKADALEWFEKSKLPSATVKAVWCAKDSPDWTYETTLPHAVFNVMEDGEVFCRGIVFSITDL